MHKAINYYTCKGHHGFIQSSVFSLKMDTLLPSWAKMPFFDTELLNLHSLLAVPTVLVMLSSCCIDICIV